MCTALDCPDTLPRQFMTFSESQHPFEDLDGDFFNDDTRTLDHFVRLDIFSTSAQRYVESQTGCEELQRAHLRMLSLFTYVHFECYRRMYIPRTERKAGNTRGPLRGSRASRSGTSTPSAAAAASSSSSSLVEDGAEADSTLAENFAQRQEEMALKYAPSALFAMMQVVPSFCSRDRPAGMWLRVGCNAHLARSWMTDFGKIVYYLCKRNEERNAAEVEGKAKSLRTQPYMELDFAAYFELIGLYMGVDVPYPERVYENIMRVGSPVHPQSVFCIEKACDLARLAGARHPFYDSASYADENGRLRFPDKNFVYLLNKEFMLPTQFFTYLWPHITKPVEDDLQRRLFIKQFVQVPDELVKQQGADGGDDDDEGVRLAREAAEKEVGALYDVYHRNRISAENANDLEGLRRHQRQRNSRVMSIVGSIDDRDNFEKYRILRKEAQLEGLKEFRQMFHKDGDLAKAVKAIAAWGDEFRKTHKNGWSLPFNMLAKNLSPFGNLYASQADQLESAFGVETLQATCVCGLEQSMEVYSNRRFHCNSLYAGLAKTGKTFSFWVQQQLLIPGSWQEYAYFTPKANTSPGKEFTHMIEFLEEAPPTMLGMMMHNANGKKQQTSGSDAEAILKLKLTRGKIVARVLMVDKVSGQRKTVDIEVEANTVMHFAMNDHHSLVPPPMLSRFHLKVFQYKERKDNSGGLLSKMQVLHDNGMNALRAKLAVRTNRNQYLSCVVQYLMYAEVLEPMDMTIAYAVFSEVMNVVREKGLTDNQIVRDFERLVCVASRLAIQEAIHTLFDCELSPFRKRQYEEDDILKIEPYLKISIENCTMALGLLHEQFENDVLKNVVRTLVRTTFAASFEAEMRGSGGLPHPDVEQRRQESVREFRRQNPHHTGPDIAAYIADDAEKRRQNELYQQSVNSIYYIAEFPSKESLMEKAKQQGRLSTANVTFSQDELVRRLAQEMLPRMSPRPLMEDLVYALDVLTQLPVRNASGDFANDSALCFSDGKIYLAKSVVSGTQNETLFSIVKKVLDSMSVSRQQYLYGQTYDSRPHIWQTIITTPLLSEPGAKPLRIINPTHFDEAVRNFTLRAVVDMDQAEPQQQQQRESDEDIESSERERNRQFYESLFGQHQHVDIDGSIERYVAAQRLKKIGYKNCDMKDLPPVVPSVLRRKIIENMSEADRAGLCSYPECYQKSSRSAAAESSSRRRRHDAEETSLLAKTQRLIDEYGYDVPDEVDSEVCEVSFDADRVFAASDLIAARQREERLLAAMSESIAASQDSQASVHQNNNNNNIDVDNELGVETDILDTVRVHEDDRVSLKTIELHGSRRALDTIDEEERFEEEVAAAEAAGLV
jgi:hypothetical protein